MCSNTESSCIIFKSWPQDSFSGFWLIILHNIQVTVFCSRQFLNLENNLSLSVYLRSFWISLPLSKQLVDLGGCVQTKLRMLQGCEAICKVIEMWVSDTCILIEVVPGMQLVILQRNVCRDLFYFLFYSKHCSLKPWVTAYKVIKVALTTYFR